jgi:Zn-dependent peptidase ImmA (M78 family)
MRKKYAKEIDARSDKLLRRLNLFSVPVDVQAVAEKLGASVIFEDLDDDVSGLLLRENNIASIVVNRQHHPNRQRFTLAHECGHLYLHAHKGDRLWLDKTLFFRDSSSSSGDLFAEIQANQFAAGLLMPEELILSALDARSPINDNDILRLALQFPASER